MPTVKDAIFMLGLSLCFAGCSGGSDSTDQKLDDLSAQQAKHPNYPIMQRVDFKGDNAPFPMQVYGNYGYVMVAANSSNELYDAVGAQKKISKAIALAIAEVQKIEKDSPPPSKPPTSKSWGTVPHPELGSYKVSVTTGVELPVIDVTGKAGTSVDQETDQVDAAAKKIVDVFEKDEAAGLASTANPVPPSGFRVTTKEALDAYAASRGNGPNPFLGVPKMLLLPIDTAKATAALKRSALEVTKQLHDNNPDAKSATVQIKGPSGETSIQVPTGSGQEAAIDAGLKPIITWLDNANKTAAHP